MQSDQSNYLPRTSLTHLAIVMALLTTITSTGCKPNTVKNLRSNSSGSGTSNQLPEPIVSERSEAELRAAFADVVEKYRQLSASEYSRSATARSLAPRRRLKRLNVQMRDPVAGISQTAKLTGSANLGAPIRAAGGVVRREIPTANIISVEFPDAPDEKYLAAVMDFLKSDARITVVEPDYMVSRNITPNDPSFNRLWGLSNASTGIDIKAPLAWDFTTGDARTIIAVIDSGIDCTHEDLKDNCWTNPGESGVDSSGRSKSSNGVDDDRNGYIDDWQGWNFVDGNNRPNDDNGHGTHVAGTIAATGNNGKGVTGVNWRAALVPLKFLDANGDGYLSDVIAAIDYATDIKAFASNNSWGGGGYSFLTALAIDRASSAGSLFIAAAGNEQNNNDANAAYPGNYSSNNVISVAAINRNGELAWFSNYGASKVDLAAPGEGIYSTMPGNTYASLSGTSMAAPHVTGALALLRTRFPNFTSGQLINLLLDNVTSRSTLSGKVKTGGIANVYAAINAGPDLDPPSVPDAITVFERALNSATVTWTPSGDDGTRGNATRYEMRISTARIDSDSSWNGATPVTLNNLQITPALATATISDLPAGFTGWAAMRAWDESNNASEVSPSVPLTLIPMDRVNFYDGSTARIPDSDSPWVIENDTQRGNVFSDGPGSYQPNAYKKMSLPPVSLAQVQNIALRFWTSHSLEQDNDRGVILASYSGLPRSEWIEVGSVTGKSGWQQRTLDLTAAATRIGGSGHDEMMLHFELQSDGSVQYEGWLLDDIEILTNTSLIQINGIPPAINRLSEFRIAFNAPAGTLYTSALRTANSGPADCSRDQTYTQPIPQTSIELPLAGSIPDPGAVFLCLRFKVPGYAGTISTFATWKRVTGNPEITIISGLPEGRSNKRELDLTVTPTTAGAATAASIRILNSNAPIPVEACLQPDSQSIQSNNWSNWYALGSIKIDIAPDNGYRRLCARGKDDTGMFQETPLTHAWYADFSTPVIELRQTPPELNALANFEVQISSAADIDGTFDLAFCKAAIVTGTTNCPQSPVSYSSCSLAPAKHSVSTITDGLHTLCIIGEDLAGNPTATPTRFTWTRDTIVQPIRLSGVPTDPSSTTRLNVTVEAGESGRYRYLLTKGTDCSASELAKRPLIATTIAITDALPLADSQFTICAEFIDAAGNKQMNPSVHTWRKDTWPPIALVNNPPPASTPLSQWQFTITGNDVASYQWSLIANNAQSRGPSLPASTACAIAAYGAFAPVATPMTIDAGTSGPKILCIRAKDAAGNLQRSPTFIQWTQIDEPVVTPVPRIQLASGAPFGPTAKSWWNISPDTSTTELKRLSEWRHAFILAKDHPCSGSNVPWTPWQPITSKFSINDTSRDGYRTLCLEGRDKNGRVQDVPTRFEWVKLLGAPLVEQTIVFGTLSRTTPDSTSGTSEKFKLERTDREPTKMTVPVKVCKLNPPENQIVPGQFSGCKSGNAKFAANSSTEFNISGINSGTWVVIALPTPGQGRVEPILFKK